LIYNIVKKSLFLLLVIFVPISLFSQSFYREREPKTDYFRLGFGAATFFSAPRRGYGEIKGSLRPSVNLGIGRKYSEYFSLGATASFNPFSNYELLNDNSSTLNETVVFSGYQYAVDITPTLNLIPSYHHMSRPFFNLNLGLGLGYLLTYKTERFKFEEKEYEFSFFESSVYFPIRTNFSFKIGPLSDLELEGVFFYTFLNNSSTRKEFEIDGDHFGQLNLNFKKYFK